MTPPPDGDRPGGDGSDNGRREREAAMQRVRVGVTGLAAVFLLTLLAASILQMLGQDTRPHGRAAAALAAEAPREPLAELGVAPGNAPKPPVAPVAKPVGRRPVANAQAPASPH